jgi:Pvc16 N-terminal domain
MLPAVAQTLAGFLAGGMSLISTEDIGFEHPSRRNSQSPSLNLYLYDIQQNSRKIHPARLFQRHSGKNGYLNVAVPANIDKVRTFWFDASFLLTAQDYTAMGRQRLFSEALSLLIQHSYLPKHFLVPALQGHGDLPLQLKEPSQRDSLSFWQSLGIPRQPALCITVTAPMNAMPKPSLTPSGHFIRTLI